MNILACDCGTSTCRALVYEGDSGRRLGEWSRPVPSGIFSKEGAEASLSLLWPLLCELLKASVEGFAGPIDAVGVSTLFGYHFLDHHLEPLGNATTWIDHRAEAEARSLAALLAGEPSALRSGRLATGELLIPKLMHLAASEPERFRRISHVLGIKDEIVRRLTGEIGTDYAHADYSGGFSPVARELIPEVWEAAGLSPRLLPDPRPAVEEAGRITSEAARATGLAEGTPVVRGASDGSAAMYGCGVMIPGVAAFVSGTTDVLMARLDGGASGRAASSPDRALTFNTCLAGAGVVAGGAMGLSGGAASWIASLTGRGIDELEAAAGTIRAGAENLLMVPSLTGERSPFWNPRMSGAFIGLRSLHTPAHLFRSCLEGSAVRAALLLDRLAGAGAGVRALILGGGGTRSSLWNQIRADATGLPVEVPADPEATGRGTALFCRAMLEGSSMSEERFGEVSRRWLAESARFSPDVALRPLYDSLRREYERYAVFQAA